MTDATEAELAGASSYTRGLLRFYDIWVLGFNNRFVWRCPTANLTAMYADNASRYHLDVGPGTGYHLAHAPFPAAAEVTLVDLNPAPLEMASTRLRARGIDPVTHRGSVLSPLSLERRQFSSISACLLMHCVPGTWNGSKGKAFQYLAELLASDGVFFGATVLGEVPDPTVLGRAVSAWFNRAGVFDNATDDLAGLQRALDDAFEDVDLRMIGSVALWTARRPRGR